MEINLKTIQIELCLHFLSKEVETSGEQKSLQDHMISAVWFFESPLWDCLLFQHNIYPYGQYLLFNSKKNCQNGGKFAHLDFH